MPPTVRLRGSPAIQQNPRSHWLFPQPGPLALGSLLQEAHPEQSLSSRTLCLNCLRVCPGLRSLICASAVL